MQTPQRDNGRARTVLILLVLTALAVISLDAGLGDRSPAKPVRQAASSALGPAESGVTRALSPLAGVTDYFSSRDSLLDENDRLRKQNADLRAQVNSADIDRNRLAEYDRLAKLADRSDFDTVDARVVGYGSAQSFQRTVTIDAGTNSGVREDMTVLGPDGLVGRVIRATGANATVLLIVDRSSVVGARLGSDNELGTLRGDGSLSGAGRLTLTAVDPTDAPVKGDAVVSWGSRDGVPYVADVPIGRVEDVTSSPRDQSATVTVAPYVDFSALDQVAVVVGRAPDGRG
ncbi:MAG: rod shape-determining protein MreC [Nocardioidaceae bacterium]